MLGKQIFLFILFPNLSIKSEQRNRRKRPSRGVLKKMCSENMQQICRGTPMPKCDFNKLQSNFFEITLWHGFPPANLLHIFRTPFPKNTSGWLLLNRPADFIESVLS